MDAAMLELGGNAAVIGEITGGDPGVVSVLDAWGNPMPRAGAGWDHFAD
jgi:hypothetical protein